MDENQVKRPRKKWKALLAIILASVVLISSFSGVLLLLRQPDGTITDYTTGEGVEPTASDGGAGGGTGEPQVAVSTNVKVMEDADSQRINAAISQVKTMSDGIYMTVQKGTKLDTLGVGDVFFLNGSSNTPMGEPFFGKITSMKTEGNNTKLIVTNPTVDEVFDKLSLSTENVLANGTATVGTMEGVTVTNGGRPIEVSRQPDDSATALTQSGFPKASALGRGEQQEVTDMAGKTYTYTPSEDLKFAINVDLVEAYTRLFGSNKDKNKQEEDEAEHKEEIKKKQELRKTQTVYVTPTGYAYHAESCFQLKKAKEKIPTTVLDALQDGKTPCKNCLDSDRDVFEMEDEVKLSGEIGIKDLVCNIYYDWDIATPSALQDLHVQVTSTPYVNVALNIGAEMSLGGQSTEMEWDIGLASVKLQGLKEKLFPIGYISCTQSFAVVYTGGNRAMVSTLTQTMPVSILIMVYVDVQGNLSIGASAQANWSRTLNYDKKLIENGKHIRENATMEASKTNFTWSVEAGVQGDIDVHLGVSVMLYVFNLNLVDVGLAKLGSEAEGKLGVTLNQDVIEGTEPWFEASVYGRIYLKLLDIKLNISGSISALWGIAEGSANIKWDWTALDWTIWSFGAKATTGYSKETMKCTSVTARDADAVYYKDEDGRLIMEKDQVKTVLYDEEFFIICSIDQSYIYILKTTGSKKFTMYRISKENSTAKDVLVDVADVLYADESAIYFVNTTDPNTIRKYNREKQTDEAFATLGASVQLLHEQDGFLYAVTVEQDLWSSLFGGATNRYYLLNEEGTIIEDYGSNPDVTNYSLYDRGSYYEAVFSASSGMLRDYAKDVYWMSKDRTRYIKTEHNGGWNFADDVGIFTTLNNHGAAEGALPLKIVLYQAADGTRRDVVEVASDQAFFTLNQSRSGDWYYIDQTETELILYTMSKDFTNKQVVKTFSREELPYNLTDCSMVIEDESLYFYSIVGEDECTVIKRFDLN